MNAAIALLISLLGSFGIVVVPAAPEKPPASPVAPPPPKESPTFGGFVGSDISNGF